MTSQGHFHPYRQVAVRNGYFLNSRGIGFEPGFHGSIHCSGDVFCAREEPFIRIVSLLAVFVNGEFPISDIVGVGQATDGPHATVIVSIEIEVTSPVSGAIKKRSGFGSVLLKASSRWSISFLTAVGMLFRVIFGWMISGWKLFWGNEAHLFVIWANHSRAPGTISQSIRPISR